MALVPDLHDVREELPQGLDVRVVQGGVEEGVDGPDPLPPAVLVVVLPLAVLERDPEVGLVVDEGVRDLQRVPDPALVHRTVHELDRRDARGPEPGLPGPVPVREGVREERPALVRGLHREVDVHLVEPLPDLPEIVDDLAVQALPLDVLLADGLDDLLGLLLELRIEGLQPVAAAGGPALRLALRRCHGHGPIPSVAYRLARFWALGGLLKEAVGRATTRQGDRGSTRG